MPARANGLGFVTYSAIVIVSVLGLPCRVSARSENGQAAELLLQLLDQYRSIHTIHCKAATSMDYKSNPPGICHVDGTLEYWAEGSQYRIRQERDSSVLSGMSHDVRWNGEQFQWFDIADGNLIVSKVAAQKTPYLAEPMPLLPLCFLNPTGAEFGEKLDLSRLQSDGQRQRLSAAPIAKDRDMIEFPAGRVGDKEYTYRIECGTTPAYLPTRIACTIPGGVELNAVEITYEPVVCDVATVYLPSSAHIIIRNSMNKITAVSSWKIADVEINSPIPSDTFTIDFQRVRAILDVDEPPTLRARAKTLVGAYSGHAVPENSVQRVVEPLSTTGDRDDPSFHLTALFGCGILAMVVGAFVIRRIKVERGRTK